MPINHHKNAFWLLCLLFCMPTLGVAMCNTSLGNAGVEPAGLSLFFTPLPALHGAYTGQEMLPPTLEDLQSGNHRQMSAGERAFLVASEAPWGKVAGVGAKASRLLGVVEDVGKGGSNVLSKAELHRIENAATRINKPITVVGSRASGKAGAYSDWDYVIEGLTSKSWSKIKNSLPGSRSMFDNTPRNIDIFKGPVDPNLPHITIYPR